MDAIQGDRPIPPAPRSPRTTEEASEGAAIPVRCVGIVGAGAMGRGIAAVSLRAGRQVLLFDADQDVTLRALDELRPAPAPTFPRRPHFLRSKGSLTAARSLAELASADLVIEAVPEDLAIKREILTQLQAHLSSDCLIATNTSSIPLSSLASAVEHPGRLCGLHFCHPVTERALVEVIAGPETSPSTLQRACESVRSLGKNPIIVRDSPGFLLNRVLSPYLTESLQLLLEGAAPSQLDQVARDFGMPWGPLRQLDEFGVDVALAVGATLVRAFPQRFNPSELLIAMYKARRLGRKTGAGFCEGETDDLAAETRQIISSRRRATHRFTLDEVERRVLLPMLLEGIRTLDEGIVDAPETIDVILRDGLGMTAKYRGLFEWARQIGAGTLLAWLAPLSSLGERYLPPASLQGAVTRRNGPVSRAGIES